MAGEFDDNINQVLDQFYAQQPQQAQAPKYDPNQPVDLSPRRPVPSSQQWAPSPPGFDTQGLDPAFMEEMLRKLENPDRPATQSDGNYSAP